MRTLCNLFAHSSKYPFTNSPFIIGKLLSGMYAVICIMPFALTAQDSTGLVKRLGAITSSNPSVIGIGYWGTLSIGGNFQNTTRLTNLPWGPDGNVIINCGLGNPEKSIGANLQINIYGLDNVRGEPSNFGEGTLNIHFSRQLNEKLWVGIGGYDLVSWRASLPNKLKSIYSALCYDLKLRDDSTNFFSHIYITGGVGNGRFRKDADFTLKRSNPAGYFASVAIQILREGNLMVEWSGYGLYSGISFYPFKKLPFNMIVGYDDILNHQRRFMLAGSVGFNLKKGGGNKRYLPPPPPPQMSRV